jgi:hypothetical protein
MSTSEGYGCLDKRFITPSLANVFRERASSRVRRADAEVDKFWDEMAVEALKVDILGDVSRTQDDVLIHSDPSSSRLRRPASPA